MCAIDGKEHRRQDRNDAERNGLSMAAGILELAFRADQKNR
jgi:hypothetical protein